MEDEVPKYQVLRREATDDVIMAFNYFKREATFQECIADMRGVGRASSSGKPRSITVSYVCPCRRHKSSLTALISESQYSRIGVRLRAADIK